MRAGRSFGTAATLIAAFVGVILMFTLATVLTEVASGKLDESVVQISTNAAPSLESLSAVRDGLRRVFILRNDSIGVTGPGEPTAPLPLRAAREHEAVIPRAAMRSRVGEAEADLRRDIAAALSTPDYPGEGEYKSAIRVLEDELHGDLDRVLGALDDGDVVTARRLMRQELRPTTEKLTTTVTDEMALNMRGAARDAYNISVARRRIQSISFLLQGLSVVLSIMVAGLAVRLVRDREYFLRALTDTLEQRNAELELFSSRMAHDVRTPLSTLSILIDLWQRLPNADEHFRASLARGRRGVTQATAVVDALYEFARAGATPIAGGRAVVAEALEEAAADARGRAGERGALVNVACAVPAGTRVAAERGILLCALFNLGNNALKHACREPGRTIRFRASLRGAVVRFEVEDDGPGVPASLRDHLFQLYARRAPHADEAGRKDGGLGLGLATVKRIVEAHGGQVGVESVEPSGARFWFELSRVVE